MSIDLLPDLAFRPCGPASRAALAGGWSTLLEVAEYVSNLPYGRNSNRADYLLVFTEKRGTCSTKHALLAALGREQDIDVHLVLGIYEMDGTNTPGVGSVLKKHGLRALPEAHCFMRYQGEVIDVTMPAASQIGRSDRVYLYEEIIRPVDIGAYKVDLHHRVLREWLSSQNVDMTNDVVGIGRVGSWRYGK